MQSNHMPHFFYQLYLVKLFLNISTAKHKKKKKVKF